MKSRRQNWPCRSQMADHRRPGAAWRPRRCGNRGGVPTAGGQSSEDTFFGPALVKMERLRVKLGGEFPNPPLFYEISNLRLALTEQRSRVHGRKSVWGHRIKAGALIAPVAKIRSRNLKLRQRWMNREGDGENCGQCDRRTAAQGSYDGSHFYSLRGWWPGGC
jgi:hypothetical protein